MSRFSYQEQVATSASVDESFDAVRRALADLGAGPRVVDRDIVGSLGSRLKVRIFGLTFAAGPTGAFASRRASRLGAQSSR